MTAPPRPPRTAEPGTPAPRALPMIGYAFMGKAHSNAWRNVASYFDVPAFEQKVLVGRDAGQVAAAAAKYGWAESATDWRAGDRPGRHPHRGHLRAGLDARRNRHRGAGGGQARAGGEAAGQHPGRGRSHGGRRPGRPRTRRAVHDRLQLPPGAGPGPGPGADRRGPAGHRPARPRRLPAGLAGGRRVPHDVAAEQGNRRLRARWATSPPTPSTRSCSCSGDTVTEVSGRLHTFVHQPPRARTARKRSRSTTPPGPR